MDLKTKQEGEVYDKIRRRMLAQGRMHHVRSGFPILSLPDDLAQDAMVQVMVFFGRLEERTGAPVVYDDFNIGAASAWGAACLRNAFISETRAARLRPRPWAPLQGEEEEDPPEIPCTRPTPEQDAIARSFLASARNHLQSVHVDSYINELEAMLAECSDAAFNRRTLRASLGLSPKQLQRLANEISRRGLRD